MKPPFQFFRWKGGFDIQIAGSIEPGAQVSKGPEEVIAAAAALLLLLVFLFLLLQNLLLGSPPLGGVFVKGKA